MRICVFCSASTNLAPEHYEMAAEVGRWIAAHGHTLVFGGTDMGMMEAVAQAAHDGGASVEGVVPTRVEQRGRLSQLLDVHIPCCDLTDRKALMMERSDAFVALPGGIGTLDEVFTVAAAATLGYHHKPLALLNTANFWQPLISALDNMAGQGAIRGEWRQYIKVVDSLDELAQIVSSPA